MPEGIEVEYYRRALAGVVGRRIVKIDTPDLWYLKDGIAPEALAGALRGQVVVAARRRGKLLMADLDTGHVLGLRFGMTGRLIVDGTAAIDRLQYSSPHAHRQWDRLVLAFEHGGEVRVNDPRRLGGVVLDPDQDALGPDMWVITKAELREMCRNSSAPLKARLMDQRQLAGLGNLLADELSWRAGLDPARPASSLGAADIARLARALPTMLAELEARGGSHTGDLVAERHADGRCPRDGTPLVRRTVGGRTTYSCPAHQR